MARTSDCDDPLSALRRLLRDVRDAARLANSRDAARLCPELPEEQRQGALRGTIEIALYRLPARQREILRRHDLEGEPAHRVQRALALSRRQFFRDRRAGLTVLNAFLFGGSPAAAPQPEPQGAMPAPRARVTVNDAQAARRTLARGLWQSGNAACLDVLSELAALERDAVTQTELLLDLADAAADYENEPMAGQAMEAARALAGRAASHVTDHRDYVAARVLRMRARFDPSIADARVRYADAAQLLRAELARDPSYLQGRFALSQTLSDLADADFSLGAPADSITAAAEAATIVHKFALSSRPTALETLGLHALLDGAFSGRTRRSIQTVSELLLRAIDAGWCATASRLSANLVGLNAICGDYAEAIRWYERTLPLVEGARPADRSNLAFEAAHAYTMTGRPDRALHALGSVKPGAGCPRSEEAEWHAFAAAALERIGNTSAALEHAQIALARDSAGRVTRRIADGHRLIAVCNQDMGKNRQAREHIVEAQRLAELHGTPYQLLRTLRSKAEIFDSAPLRREARELTGLLGKAGSG